MKRIDNTSDLTGHDKECFVKHNLDGTDCVLCVCAPEKKVVVKKVVKEEEAIELPVFKKPTFDFEK